jgi:hypothetical protein
MKRGYADTPQGQIHHPTAGKRKSYPIKYL